MSYLDAFVFVACLVLGFVSRINLLRLYVYTFPYIAANLLVTVAFPVNVGRICGGVVILFALAGLVQSQLLTRKLMRTVLVLLILTSLITAAGLIWILWSGGDAVSYWAQTPLERAGRSTLREAFFWLIPFGFAAMVRKSSDCRLLLRDFLIAGTVYSALGLTQLAIGIATGRDIFPIIRGSVENLQDMVGDAGPGRISSICGEPRYLSSFLTVWFIVTLLCGSWIGLRRWHVRGLCLFFLAVSVLTGSRSGLAELALVLIVMIALALVPRYGALRRPTVEFLGFAAICVICIASIDGLVLRSRIGENNAGDRITIAGYQLPIEFQDEEAIRLLIEKPYALVFGFGDGLWQYSSDVDSFSALRDGVFGGGGAGLESLRQNISGLGLLTNFGVVGIMLAFSFYTRSFRIIRSYPRAETLASQFGPVIIVLIATAFAGPSDEYANVLVMVASSLWLFSAMDRNRTFRTRLAQGDTLPHTATDIYNYQIEARV